ncbi:MAG: molybdate ABC transporter permease subunit [Planctomycetes bacterium]|nr:molybdate ABC transporter permease subunit [Planctomycetota bacterium]
MKRSRRDLCAALMLLPVVAGVLLFAMPLLGLALRAPWHRVELVIAPAVIEAMTLSLQVSLLAAALSFMLGLPLAAWLARGDTLSRRLVRVLVILPLVLPPVVGGVALLAAFGRSGFLGRPAAEWFGLVLPSSVAGVVLAATYVAMPFFVLTVEAALRAFDRRFAAVAATLGASPWRRTWSVTLPMIAPALGAGLVVAWARALGEFGATMMFAGNLAGRTRTMPLLIYSAFEADPDVALALSLLLALVSAAILFVLRERWFPIGERS